MKRIPTGKSVLMDLRLKLSKAGGTLAGGESGLSKDEVRALRAQELLFEFDAVRYVSDEDLEHEVERLQKGGISVLKAQEIAKKRCAEKQRKNEERWNRMRPKDRDRVMRIRSKVEAIDQGRIPLKSITDREVRALELTLVRTHPFAVLSDDQESKAVDLVRQEARRVFENETVIRGNVLNRETGIFEEVEVAGPFATLQDAYKYFNVYKESDG